MASIVVIVLLAVSLTYYALERPGPEATPSPSTSGEAVPVVGAQTLPNAATKEKAALLNCTGPEEAFINEGGIYSQLGYPIVVGNSHSPTGPLSPGTFYLVYPAGDGIAIGDLVLPMISFCQALSKAISSLGIDSANYTLAKVILNDGEAYPGGGAGDPTWTFFFAQVYQGYWIDGGMDGYYFSATATVNPVKGSVNDLAENSFILRSAPRNFTLNFNSTQALENVRHTTKMDEGPSLVANGTLSSIDLRLGTVWQVYQGSYPSIQPVNDSTSAEQLRLLWIITTNAPNYVGYFVVDAETGQVVEAEGESTLPCGGAPNCGTTTTTEYLTNVFLTPYYDQTSGLRVPSEFLEVNGSSFGLSGNFSVEIPHVIVMAPGSSGSIGLNVTGEGMSCSTSYCPSSQFQVAPSIGPFHPGVSVSFSDPVISLKMGATVNDTMLISVSPTAAEGTYIVLLDNKLYSSPDAGYGGYFILSIWNGLGQWPPLAVGNP
ncbi:MAG: hypothetical protein OK442_03555 [Thaumarchaeota archaeon]|nr:hypothetical protein [Nitrososphaerota archaeon]